MAVPSDANSILPAFDAELVVNDVELSHASRAISIAVQGTIEVIMESGKDIVFPSGTLLPGLLHPIRITKVVGAGTTATGIVAYR